MACTIEDGILKPCPGLDRGMEDESNSRRKGVTLMELSDLKDDRFTLSRTFAVLRGGNLGANGAVLNYCPFCGASIAHHLKGGS